MIKKILLVIVVLLAVLAVVIQFQPSTFSVTRTATIGASAEKAFELVNDFHNWEKWSPWMKLDPNTRTTYSGSPSGIGAVFAWAGNSAVGEGNMTITSSVPSTHIGIRLEFTKPFASTAQNEFAFASTQAPRKSPGTCRARTVFCPRHSAYSWAAWKKPLAPTSRKALRK